MDTPEDNTPTVTFYRVYPDAIPPMRADKAALGVLPTMAFRHCEPVRAASSFGWYIFPPEDIALRWNGSDTLVRQDGEWRLLDQVQLPGLTEYWNQHCPDDLKDLMPAYLSKLPAPGLLQIWSGLLCGARTGWSVLVRPLANLRPSPLYQCYEGVVEADRFQPFPLFMNIQLIATDVVIELPKIVPLFQVQPLARMTYGEEAHRFDERVGLAPGDDEAPPLTQDEWQGYRNTIRVQAHDEAPEPARYANASRRRGKHEVK